MNVMNPTITLVLENGNRVDPDMIYPLVKGSTLPILHALNQFRVKKDED